MKLFIGQADVEIQRQWTGNTRHDRFARTPAVGTAQQLPHQPAIGNRGITMPLTRRPPRRLGSQCIDHGLPVVQRFGGQQLTQCRQAGPMAEQLAQGNCLLARRGELGPVPGNRRIELQLAFGNQLQGRHGGKGLGAGEQVGDGIAVPGFTTVLVRRTGPQVDDCFAADLNAQCSTAFLRIVEEGRKRFSYRFEFKLVMTLNLHPPLPGQPSRYKGPHCSSP
ncbi:hypothetical protein D3C78_1214500 [compost metagenome]